MRRSPLDDAGGAAWLDAATNASMITTAPRQFDHSMTRHSLDATLSLPRDESIRRQQGHFGLDSADSSILIGDSEPTHHSEFAEENEEYEDSTG
jgi:hypothetical protein